MRRPVTFLVLLACALLVPAAAAQALNVYAAASLREALPRIAPARFNFAGSNQLQLQIERGAPADVFASAEPTEARALFRQGRCTRPVTFATNRLVLVVPSRNRAGIRSAYSLRRGRLRISVGTAGVPIGAYTRRLLARMRLSSVLRSNAVSQEPNVAGVLSKVALGSADAGFVYHTDALAARGRVRELALPRWAQPPVRYHACVVRRRGGDGAGGNAFLRRLTSTPGRRVLRRYGFGLPPRG